MTHENEYCEWVFTEFSGDPSQYPWHVQYEIYQCNTADVSHLDPVMMTIVIGVLALPYFLGLYHRYFQSGRRVRQATLDDFPSDDR